MGSYWVATLKIGKLHTSIWFYLLPKRWLEWWLGRKQLNNLISTSDNTVKRHIDDMAEDVLKQLVSRIQASCVYALQIHESTDIASLSDLLAFVWYEYDVEIHEDLLYGKPLPSHITAETILETLNTFKVSNQIDWTKCVGLITDRARAIVGRLTGVVKRVKHVAPLVTAVHCSIHREALATKTRCLWI